MILRRLLLSVAAVAVAVCVSAQNVFMVQGHERPDITARMAQMPARAAADEAVEDTDFSFDDIEFWVGTGSDSAALVIDWYDDKGGTLVCSVPPLLVYRPRRYPTTSAGSHRGNA